MDKTQELNGSHTDVSETPKPNSSELVDITPIEGTPFTKVRVDDKHFLALGKYRLTPPLENESAVIEEAKNTDWDRLLQIMRIMAQETYYELNKK